MDLKTEILSEVAKGDAKAFKLLYDTLSVKVYNIVLSYTQNTHDAEEVTQEVFVKIHKYAKSFKGNSSVSTWVYRIAVNASLDFLKKKKKYSFMRPGIDKVESVNFEHPGVLMDRMEDAKTLYSAIDTLPDNQKSAFILSFIEGLPRQEVADTMELTLKATESLLQRAKKNLRNKLEKLYQEQRN